tara:strand:+ start:196 stop:795 length:600 start_codon:yes stop_codon:yes gene_type:complete
MEQAVIESQNIFPTQVFRATFGSANELQRTIVPVLLEQEKNDTDPLSYTANGYTDFGRENLLERPVFKELKDFIDDAIVRCHRQSGLQQHPKLTGSWFSINRKYTYHEEHNHLPDVWSGVYYIQADQDHPGLTLVNQNLTSSNWPGMWGRTELNEVNSSSVTCQAVTGTLLIFPSYLNHKVEQQKVDKERIMVAFNYGF